MSSSWLSLSLSFAVVSVLSGLSRSHGAGSFSPQPQDRCIFIPIITGTAGVDVDVDVDADVGGGDAGGDAGVGLNVRFGNTGPSWVSIMPNTNEQ